jgi:hypothetical protein
MLVKHQLNQHMVCVNPDKEIVWRDEKFYCDITLAVQNGEWAMGYHFEVYGSGEGCGGAGGGPSFGKYKKVWPTRDEARHAALVHAHNFFTRKKAEHSFPCSAVIDAIKVAMAGKQLSLFN